MESIFALNELDEVAGRLLNEINGYNVIAFHGNLGAGKTTLIQALCKKTGVNSAVSSPTFSIINQYNAGNKTIYHIDLYRIKDDEEAMNAGVEECIYSGETCFIEWPDRISFLPSETVHIFIEASNGKRKLVCKLPE